MKDICAFLNFLWDFGLFLAILLLIMQNEGRASHDYMDSQPEINERMRSILIDWLIQVHYKFELSLETLYLTINIIDRFLSLKAISRKELQLVGMASMLVASKYEEIWAPQVRRMLDLIDLIMQSVFRFLDPFFR